MAITLAPQPTLAISVRRINLEEEYPKLFDRSKKRDIITNMAGTMEAAKSQSIDHTSPSDQAPIPSSEGRLNRESFSTIPDPTPGWKPLTPADDWREGGYWSISYVTGNPRPDPERQYPLAVVRPRRDCTDFTHERDTCR